MQEIHLQFPNPGQWDEFVMTARFPDSNGFVCSYRYTQDGIPADQAPALAEMLDASMLVEPEAVIGLTPVGALLEEGAIPLTGEVALASAGSQAEAAGKHRRQVAANKRAALFAGLDRLVG